MMRIVDCTRREFIDLLQSPSQELRSPGLLWLNEGRAGRVTAELPPPRSELQLLWPEWDGKQGPFPRVVC